MHLRIVLSSLVFMLMSFSVNADNIYCGSKIIDEGVSQDEVLEHCGEPTERRDSSWYYDRGSDQLGVTIHFEVDGTVNRIDEDPDE